MIESTFIQLFFTFAAGVGLGLFYFGGLWLTVKYLPMTRWPALLAFSSLMGRMGFSLYGFYLVMDGRWERLLVCLSGFILIRSILVRRLRPGRTSFNLPSGRGAGCDIKS